MSERPGYLERSIRKIAVDVRATEAAAFAVERDVRQRLWMDVLVHIRPDCSDPEVRARAIAAFKDVISPCVDEGKDGAIEVDDRDAGQGKQYCIVTLVRRGSEIVGVAAFIVRCRDLDGARAVVSRVRRNVSGL